MFGPDVWSGFSLSPVSHTLSHISTRTFWERGEDSAYGVTAGEVVSGLENPSSTRILTHTHTHTHTRTHTCKPARLPSPRDGAFPGVVRLWQESCAGMVPSGLAKITGGRMGYWPG